MAFVFLSINDATGSPLESEPNSYASVSELDDYFDGRYENELWTGLSTAEKQRIAVTATNRIDQEDWYGTKTSDTQQLQFPRDSLFDRNGNSLANDAPPQNLINAQAELIYFYLASEDRMVSELDLHDAKYVSKYSVGPLSYEFNKGVKANQLPMNVQDELKAIGDAWISLKNPTIITR